MFPIIDLIFHQYSPDVCFKNFTVFFKTKTKVIFDKTLYNILHPGTHCQFAIVILPVQPVWGHTQQYNNPLRSYYLLTVSIGAPLAASGSFGSIDTSALMGVLGNTCTSRREDGTANT